MESFEDTLVSAKAGDIQAADDLFQRWRPLMRLHAAKSLGRDVSARVDPSDVVQETLIQATQDLPRFEGQSEGQWVRWLQQMLAGNAAKIRRHHLAQKRAVKRDVAVTESQFGVRPQPTNHSLEKLEEAAQLAKAIDQLPEEMRFAISERVLWQRPWEQIAKEMGKPTGTVRALWTRGLRKLKQIMQGTSSP